MELSELLEEIRDHHLKAVKLTIEKLSERPGVEVITEPALVNDNGDEVCEGELRLPVRQDIVVIEGEQATEALNVGTESVVSFEPVNFEWEGGLQVEMTPFQWDYLSLKLPTGPYVWKPLQEWYWQWFSVDEDNVEEWLGAVHFLSDPKIADDKVSFVADLGSAPVDAFEGLLDALAAAGASRVAIGQAEEARSS